MSTTTAVPRRILLVSSGLEDWMDEFLLDRRARNLSKGTIKFYKTKLKLFKTFCMSKGITLVEELTPALIRDFLLELEERGYSPGGRHACYRTLKTFLRWWEEEVEPENWRNPISKVDAPKIDMTALEPVSVENVRKLIHTCHGDSLIDARDNAILHFLLDTGVRAGELCDLQIEDVLFRTNSATIRHGKVGKTRDIYFGKRTRRALRRYLRKRTDQNPSLWITRSNSSHKI